MYFQRYYQDLDILFKNRNALLIFGPRRVGKTTLINKYLSSKKYEYKLVHGDNLKIQEVFSSQDSDLLFEFTEGIELLVIDEAQLIPDVGKSLKILIDQKPDIKIIATGSSSFELAGQAGEPLVGRKWDIKMFPISFIELRNHYNSFELKELLERILIYGSYPDVLITKEKTQKIEILEELKNAYLLKDILDLERVKGAKVLLNILKLLAFQVGSEVSLHEIATKVGLDYKTVGRYIDLFEKSYIIFSLQGYSGNLRNTITSKLKYYFYDNGIRNAVISAYNNLEDRNDIGILWENFLVTERIKKLIYHKEHANKYFWRTWEQKEIDWVEERDGKLYGYEFKYKEVFSKHSKAFIEAYNNSSVEVVNKDNFLDFII